jgi:sugar-specific transcriptional regulator TrmB
VLNRNIYILVSIYYVITTLEVLISGDVGEKMIVGEQFLSKLKHFGLNSYQAKLWTALLSRGVATAGELSDISNVPRSRAYDVLESLEKKGFIIMKIGKPIKYIAVPPHEVVNRVKKRISVSAQKATKQVEDLKGGEMMSELSLLYSQGVDKVEPTELTASIRGRNNLYDHLAGLMREAKKEVVLSTTSQGLVRKADALKHVMRELQKKGVKVRIAAPVNADNEKAAKELAVVAEVRHSTLDSRFMIVDGKKMTFMLVSDKEVNSNYDSGVTVDSPFFVGGFQAMFENAWQVMKKVE